MPTTIPINLDQLEAEGYTVIRGFLSRDVTRALREHMDSLLPPVAPADAEAETRIHTLRHPIPGKIMADVLANPDLLEVAGRLLRGDDLRVLEQVLIRTDPSPPPHGPGGWHVDWAFAASEYQATPRRTYFHHVHALNTVPPGGGAFMIVPGSHHKTYAAAAEAPDQEGIERLKRDPINVAGIDPDKGIEVCPEEGDLLVFNPMALHSGSKNATTQPRYVYFASFTDASATEFLGAIGGNEYHKTDWKKHLRQDLPAEHQSLLDW